MKATDIGMIGLGVMGSNPARNMVSKGFTVSCYDWSESYRKNFAGKYKEGFVHADDLKDFIKSIGRPRKIMMMVTVELNERRCNSDSESRSDSVTRLSLALS